jgi:phosphohistidine phosphatase SixA
VVRLEDYPVDQILCSPTLRCHQTVEPLARDRLLRIDTVPAHGADAKPAQLLDLVWDLELRSTVLCIHGEGIGLLLTRLLAGAPNPPPDPAESARMLMTVNREYLLDRFAPGDDSPAARESARVALAALWQRLLA